MAFYRCGQSGGSNNGIGYRAVRENTNRGHWDIAYELKMNRITTAAPKNGTFTITHPDFKLITYIVFTMTWTNAYEYTFIDGKCAVYDQPNAGETYYDDPSARSASANYVEFVSSTEEGITFRNINSSGTATINVYALGGELK